MNKAAIKDILEYNYWADKLLLAKAEEVTPEQWMQRTTLPWGSLRRTMAHIVDSERGWRNIFKTGVAEFDVIVGEQFANAAEMQPRWAEDEAEMWAYFNGLSEADLQSTITYETEEGTRKRLLWHCLWHVVNHGMQHRSECAVMLTDFGHSPGDIDFTLHLNQR
jgi:uncharacterized damage-inducible protein DinB